LKIPQTQIAFLQGADALLASDPRAELAWKEISQIVEQINGERIKTHFESHGTVKSKSVSGTLTKLVEEAFQHFGWDRDWVIYKAPNGAKETFSHFKSFDGLDVAFEIGSRHTMKMLSTFMKANLAVKMPTQPMRKKIDLYVIGAYMSSTLLWGKWNGAVSSYEDFDSQADVLDGVLAHPTIIFGMAEPPELQVELNLSGTLNLRIS
jgi:hypothetical protein